MQELLQQNAATLNLARFGLDNMVHSYPGYVAGERGSMVSAIGSDVGVLGDRDSVVSDTRFVFDTICFDSKPYRHTVARVSAKKKAQRPEQRVAPSPSDPTTLLPIKEAEAEMDSESPGKPSPTAPSTGVSNEEHEAVIMKLREAEALIRTLQERLQQPAALAEDQPADVPNQPPSSVEREDAAGPSTPAAANLGVNGAAEPDEEASDSTHDSYYTARHEEVPVTIKARRTSSRAGQTQKNLLLEAYFKDLEGTTDADTKAPGMRVRIRPQRASQAKDQPLGVTSTQAVRDDRRTRKHKLSRGASSQQPVPHSAAADTLSETAVSSIPPCSFLDGTDAEEPQPPNGISSIPTTAFLDGTAGPIANFPPSGRRKSRESKAPKSRKASVSPTADAAGISNPAAQADRPRPTKHRSGETREPQTQSSRLLTSIFLDGARGRELGERRKRAPRGDALDGSRSLGEMGQTRNSPVYSSRWSEPRAGRGIIDRRRGGTQNDTERKTTRLPVRVEEIRREPSAMPKLKDEVDQRAHDGQQGTQRTPLRDATNLEPKIDQDETADTAIPTAIPPPPAWMTTTYKISLARSPSTVRDIVEVKKTSSPESDDEMVETLQPSIPSRPNQPDSDFGAKADLSPHNVKVGEEPRANLRRDRYPLSKRRYPSLGTMGTATTEVGQKEGKMITGRRPYAGVNANPGWINPERVISEISKNTEDTLRVVSSQSKIRAGAADDRTNKRSPVDRADDRAGPPKRSDIDSMEGLVGIPQTTTSRPGLGARVADDKANKRSLFRRAMDRVGSPKTNDLDGIEDMVGKLLADLNEIKVQTQQVGNGGAVEAA